MQEKLELDGLALRLPLSFSYSLHLFLILAGCLANGDQTGANAREVYTRRLRRAMDI